MHSRTLNYSLTSCIKNNCRKSLQKSWQSRRKPGRKPGEKAELTEELLLLCSTVGAPKQKSFPRWVSLTFQKFRLFGDSPSLTEFFWCRNKSYWPVNQINANGIIDSLMFLKLLDLWNVFPSERTDSRLKGRISTASNKIEVNVTHEMYLRLKGNMAEKEFLGSVGRN